MKKKEKKILEICLENGVDDANEYLAAYFLLRQCTCILSFFIFHKVFSFFVCLCQYIIPLCIYKIKEIKNILFMIAKSNAWMYKHTKHKPLHSCLDFSIMQIK